MATSETNNRQDAAAAATRRAAETRIDVAHQAKPGETLDAAAQPQPIAKGAEAAEAQVRTQAVQLAEHLRTRQKDLDHREAELHARVAQFENDMSAARLWLSERIAELQERKQQPDEEQVRREEALKKTAAELDARQKQIESAETQLAEQQAETRKLQERLAAKGAAIDRDEGQRRQLFEAERGRMLTELEEQRRAVARRSEQLDRSRAALEQLRGELGQLHRETLEIRLATEELWVQLSGVCAAGRLDPVVGGHSQQAGRSLPRGAVRASRAEGRDRALPRRVAPAAWSNSPGRNGEFEEWSAGAAGGERGGDRPADRLSARLDRREAAIRQQAERWEIERLELQQELGRLRGVRCWR